MRKFGVFFLLTSFVISSLVILSNMNIESSAPLTGDNTVIEEEIIDQPETSNIRRWDYIPEEIGYDWEDLKNNVALPNVKNITNWFTDKNNGYYSTELPFWFKLYDQKFQNAHISTNGYLSLSVMTPDYSANPEFPQYGINYYDIIAPFWDDINLYIGGSVFIANFSNRWVLEYKNVWHNYGIEIGSFEVVLYDNGLIQFNYEEIKFVGDGYTLGINRGYGEYHVQFDVIQASTPPRSFTFQNEFIVFEDDFESGVKPEWSGVNTGNFWHITNKDNHSISHSLWCANDSSNTYEKYVDGYLQPVKESVTINNLDLKYYCDATLSFWFKKQTQYTNWYDFVNISARINSKHFYLSQRYTNYRHQLFSIDWEQPTWAFIDFNLSFFCGYDHIDLTFTFDTVHQWDNYYTGFKIDDIKINASRCIMPVYDKLSISKGDEFKYQVSWFDEWRYEQTFGEWPSFHPEQQCKIKIMSIQKYSLYWEITARFWDWGEDFDKDGQSEEVKYYVYKNPINIKAGIDFFIPKNDVNGYLTSADNVDKEWWEDDRLNIIANPWDYNIDLIFDKVEIVRRYNEDGVLSSIQADSKDEWGYNERIYDMWIVDWEDENYNESYDDDHDDDELYVNIPGYDVPVLVISIFTTILFTGKWVLKSNKKR